MAMKATHRLLLAATVLCFLFCAACAAEKDEPAGDGDADGDAATDGDALPDGDTDAGDGDADGVAEEQWCDAATGLCWQNPYPETGYAYDDAVAYCDDLVWDGDSDWRLPDIEELRSLIEGCAATALGGGCGVAEDCATEAEPCLAAACDGCAAGEGPDAGCYRKPALEGPCGPSRSVTGVEGAPARAWQVDFAPAQVAAGEKAALVPVRCVRTPDEEEEEGDGDEETDGDEPIDGDHDIDNSEYTEMEIIEYEYEYEYEYDYPEDGECAPYEFRCADDVQYMCEDGEWVFSWDCYASWMTCLDGVNCEAYPDCYEQGARQCWRDRALDCSTAGIDWQLEDDCADWEGMFCQDGWCAHDEGPTFIDEAFGLEWQWLIFSRDRGQFGTWIEAAAFCEALVLDDRSDWRLPTVSELRTLVHGCPGAESGGSCGYTDACLSWECSTEGCYGCTVDEGPVGELYIREELLYEADHMSHTADFWTSSNCLYYTDRPEDQRCFIEFDTGRVSVGYKTSLNHWRCVRALE